MNKTNRANRKKGKVWPALISLLLAVGIFILLLNVETRKLAQYEKESVVVAAMDVSETKEITKENLTEYFAVVERPLSDIPQATIRTLDELVGQYVKSGIDAGSVVTKSMFGDLKRDYGESVLLGVDMEALDQSVAGTLRAGDEIDIYTVKVEDDERVTVEKALGGVTIERSYTSTGVAITKEDTTSIAQYITIPVHKDAVDTFYQSLEDGRIEIVKHPR